MNTKKIQTGYEDQDIIEAINHSKNLDPVIRHLYHTNFDSVASYIRANSGNDEDAEDFFQEAIVVFINIVRKGNFRGDSSIKTFLYSIARNLWRNELKRQNRVLMRETNYYEQTEKEEQDIQESIGEHEVKDQLLHLLEKLGDNCKKILLLFYYENLPMKEIFQHMGYETEQVARNMKYRCMNKLKGLLNEHPEMKQSFRSLLANG
ncbi:RNA polymerase sigma factor [Tunicatimonas pelagia]|uniref:RNA polymerase sigma factor n=1 Tax=Tunicatimonas pelagia TaxID=931531 RepID=UPI0026662486|nr:sigma-70 family RNA polymerase sigma factor [Tunicatimonas pelagia]WKN41601.1 sigma-70 family RNA polymerase sigma factor [Tunicatimonas pelagia]